MYGGNGGHNNSDSINDGSLVIIDQTNAATTLVGHPDGVSRLTGLAFDSTGALVAQRIGWVVGGVNGFQRAYFEIPNLPVAAQYRVTVWDYTFHQSPGSGWI